LEGLDLSSVDMLCVFHLSVGQNLSRLLSLLRRLRTATSHPTLVVMVRAEDAAEWVDQPKVRTASDLREAVHVCRELLSTSKDAPPA
jgi:hypothetical protein